jgi:hypothetical protein
MFGIDDAVAAIYITPQFKVCSTCKTTKPVKQFYFRKDSKKYRSECTSCKSMRHKKYYAEKYCETAKTKARSFRERDQSIALLFSCKHTARIKKLEFNLTVDDIKIPKFCPVLGIKLTNIQGRGKIESNASVDRIDPSKGYIKGNIQILSLRANFMKRDADRDELIAFCKNTLKMLGEL